MEWRRPLADDDEHLPDAFRVTQTGDGDAIFTVVLSLNEDVRTLVRRRHDFL